MMLTLANYESLKAETLHTSSAQAAVTRMAFPFTEMLDENNEGGDLATNFGVRQGQTTRQKA